MPQSELPIYEVIERLQRIGQAIGFHSPVRLGTGEAFAIVKDHGSSNGPMNHAPLAHALITTNLKDHRA